MRTIQAVAWKEIQVFFGNPMAWQRCCFLEGSGVCVKENPISLHGSDGLG